MHQFKDEGGRAWSIKVTTATLSRVHGLTGFWLTDLMDPFSDLNKAVIGNPTVIPNLVYAAVKPQADAEKLNDEQFAELMMGDVLGAAGEALLASVIDFFQSGQQKETSRLLLAKSKTAAGLMLAAQMTALDNLTPQMIATAASANASGATASTSPPSSD